MIEEYATVDLFCGVGGLTHGFELEGFDVTAGIDLDSTCKFAFETNNHSKFISKDVTEVSTDELIELFENKKKILIGCAPCQPYSILTKKNGTGNNGKSESRWKLLKSFVKLIKNVQPDIVSMENVPLLKSFMGGSLLNDFVEELEKEKYHVSYDIYNAQDYGVPQRRKRLVLFGSKYGKVEMIEPTNKDDFVSVKDAIGSLPKLAAGEINLHDPLHRCRKLEPLSLKRIRSTPEGGGWKDWSEDLRAECHKKVGGQAYGSAYGRMKWSDVAPTITTCCIGYNNGRFGHPEQDRAISLREAALLQSFPNDYKFIDVNEPLPSGVLARQIGNAVPVTLGMAIAKSIKNHIHEFS